MWGIYQTPSNAKRTIAIEIKRSAADYSKDKNNPQKRRGALLHSNQFFYAAPKGMINPKTLPPECGLIEVYKPDWKGAANQLSVQIKVSAPFEERFPPSWSFVMSICRQMKNGGGKELR